MFFIPRNQLINYLWGLKVYNWVMGILYVVATPIGNLEDITVRAIKTLLKIPVIACEDTRHTGQLIKVIRERYFNFLSTEDLLSSPRFISVRDFNEEESVEKILFELQLGDVALVSDAGTPLLSDPGFKIVRAALKAGIKVSPIPGAFAGATALSGAGLPTNKFLFWGFLPKKWELIPEITHVIYESPIRTLATLKLIRDKYPESKIVVASELTKIHERFIEIGDEVEKSLTGNKIGQFKGEVTILVYYN